MTDEKIVSAIEELGYVAFKDEADPKDIEGKNKYCVYYDNGLRKQDQHIFHKIIEFVFVNEEDGTFEEDMIIPTIEKTGLTFDDGDYGRLKKVQGGDIVNSLTLRFVRPRKKKICNY